MNNPSDGNIYSLNQYQKKHNEYTDMIQYIEKDAYDTVELMLRKLRNARSSYESRDIIKLQKEISMLMSETLKKFDTILKDLVEVQGTTQKYTQGKLF